MAVVRIPDENRSLHEVEQIREFLAGIDIDYQRWSQRLALRRTHPPTRF
jgi:cupin superfamily acireductone dioxygenase involved in methionine salvage